MLAGAGMQFTWMFSASKWNKVLRFWRLADKQDVCVAVKSVYCLEELFVHCSLHLSLTPYTTPHPYPPPLPTTPDRISSTILHRTLSLYIYIFLLLPLMSGSRRCHYFFFLSRSLFLVGKKTLKVLEKCKCWTHVASEQRSALPFPLFASCALWIHIFFLWLKFYFLPCVTCSELYCMHWFFFFLVCACVCVCVAAAAVVPLPIEQRCQRAWVSVSFVLS